jgi:SAM-dependent methyltransferase
MKGKRHNIRFPSIIDPKLRQDETYFYFLEDGAKRRIRFHDYDEIYKVPGLYEQLFYDRLKCQSPAKVSEVLKSSVAQSQEHLTELRVLDFGAGNGMMGDELKKYGVSRIVGVDIIPEALGAAERDRPGVYDAYYVEDFCNLSGSTRDEIASWSLDCLVTVAALGFGDIPPKAFIEAFNILREKGWVAFNIKETFLYKDEASGFGNLIRELIFSKHLDLYHLERYQHRLSIEGKPLYYFAIAGRKNADISRDFLSRLGNQGEA